MLVEFSVANFRSIKEKQTLSMMAEPIVAKNESTDENNVFETPVAIRLLKTVAIYGANASGKSNVVKALLRMMHFIEKSFQDENQIKRLEPFALDKRYHRRPIHFELVFLVKNKLYRYGFEVKNNKVTAEWLFGPANQNSVEYFTRIKDEISVNKTSFKEGADLVEGKTRDTTLFLNVAQAFNGPIAKEIKKYLQTSILITTGINDLKIRDLTLELLKVPEMKERIVNLMKAADFGIEKIDNIDAGEINFQKGVPIEIKKKIDAGQEYFILASLREVKHSAKGELPTVFIFDQFESEGTKKFLTYAGPIIQALLLGRTLVIDEFDARLHPSLTRRIIELFNSKEHNRRNAQLIFVTHDINLLDSALLRRDQIYFAEKNASGETSLYSLVNIGGVRNDASYEKDYIKGKYGALPYLGEFNIQ